MGLLYVGTIISLSLSLSHEGEWWENNIAFLESHYSFCLIRYNVLSHPISFEPIIYEYKWNFYSYVNDIYLGTPLIYFDSSKSKKYEVVNEVGVPTDDWTVSILSFTDIVFQEFLHPSFPMSGFILKYMGFFLLFTTFE